MFDHIGHRPDLDARKRDAASVGLTSLLCAAAIGFSMGLAAWQLGEPVAASLEADEELTELVLLDPQEPLVAPPAPGPPADPERAAAARGESLVPEGPPPDVDTPPAPLDEVVPDKMASRHGHEKGTTEDGEGDDPDATNLDAGGGGGGGDCVGEDCGEGPPIYAFADLQVKRRVLPTYPDLPGDRPDRVVCNATVEIDAKGVPYWVTITDCPDLFQQETRRAILKWRWYPGKVDRVKVHAQTTIRVVYKPGM